MKKHILSVLSSIFLTSLLSLSFLGNVSAGTGDFSPSRPGITVVDGVRGTSEVSFNNFKRAATICFFSGNCLENPIDTCLRATNGESEKCLQSEYEAALFADQRAIFEANSDERDFFKFSIIREGQQSRYYDTLPDNLQIGDEVRAFTYIHNNAPQCDDDNRDQAYTHCINNNTAEDTSVTINWSDIRSIKSTISASNAQPTNVSDIATLQFANNNLALEYVGNEKQLISRQGRPTSITPSNTTSFSATYDFGDFRSCFGFFRILYVDFKVVEAEPSATIEKSSVPVTTSVVPRGSEIDYTLTIRNTGNIPLTNVSVTDALDPNLTFVSAEQSQRYSSSFNNGVVTFTLNENDGRRFVPGEEVDLTFTVQVNTDTPMGSEILNKGVLSADEINDLMSNETVHTVEEGDVEVVKEAFLDFNDTPIVTPFRLGENFTYRVTITNNEAFPAFGVITARDVLPAELDFVRFDPANNQGAQANEENDTLTYSFGTPGTQTLEPGESETFRFEVEIVSLPTNSTSNQDECENQPTAIVNEVTIVGAEITPGEDCVVVPTIRLASVKRAFTQDFSTEILPNASVEVGQTFGYEIAVTNQTATDLIADFLIRDTLPAELDFVEFVDHVSMEGNDYAVTTTAPNANRQLTFAFSNLAANDTIRLRFLVTAREIPTDGQTGGVCTDPTKYNNRAWVFAFRSGQPQNNANEIYQRDLCHPLMVTPPGNNPLYTFDKQALDLDNVEIPDNTVLDYGQEYFYRLTVTNTSTQDLTELVVTDTLPSQVTFVSQVSPTNGTFSADTNTLTYDGGDLDAGETQTFTFRVAVRPQAEIPTDRTVPNTATADVRELDPLTDDTVHLLDPDGGNNPLYTFDKQALDLDNVEIPDNTVLDYGQEYFYRLTVTNTSTQDLTELVVTDTLPSQVTFVSQVAPTDGTFSADTNTLTYNGGDLDAGETQTFTFRVAVRPQAEIPTDRTVPNTATADVRELDPLTDDTVHRLDPDGGNNNPSYTMDKQALDLDNVEIPDNTVLSYGQQYRYRITVTNTSNVGLTNLVVTDELPDEIIFDSQESPTDGIFTAGTNTLVYNAGDLAAQEVKTFTFLVTVRAETEIPTATTIINNATADVTELNPINDNTIHRLPNAPCDPSVENCGGGGSGPTNPSTGTCMVNPNGSLSCIRRTPNISQPGYDLYISCLSQFATNTSTRTSIISTTTNAEKQTCTDQWANALGFSGCDPSQTSAIIDQQCTVPIIPEGGGGGGGTTSCNVSASASIEKFVKKQTEPDSAFSEKACVPVGEAATYKIEVDVSCPNINIQNAEVRIGDATIPYTSGWTWNKDGVIESSLRRVGGSSFAPVLDLDTDLGQTGVMKITQRLTSSEIAQCKSGRGLTLTYEYDVDTSLAASSDVCQLDSVAYAFVEVNAVDPLTGDRSTHHIDSRDDGQCSGFDSGDLATFGDNVQLCIARPFIQARGGSNIGVNISTDKEKVFGSDFQSQLSGSNPGPLLPSLENIRDVETSSSILTNNDNAATQYGGQLVNFGEIQSFASESDRDKFFDQLSLNALPNQTLPFGGQGDKSQANEIYFTDSISIGGPVSLPTGTTVVVNGDLNITSNFTVSGNGFIAFVVRGGNITINEGVTEIDGIFLADGGDIKSNDISDVQLQISGGLMGDAEDLLNDRVFIGDNPIQELEPAILVRFDLRLLESTPPGLEIFLGDGWRESLQ